jgi:hypothetical protein
MHTTLALPAEDRLDLDEKTAPVLQVSPLCPTCGRESAVLFCPVWYWSGSAPDPRRLVCLGCCPKPEEN